MTDSKRSKLKDLPLSYPYESPCHFRDSVIDTVGIFSDRCTSIAGRRTLWALPTQMECPHGLF